MKEANEKRDKKMRKVKSANAVIGATAIGIPFSLQQGSTDRAVRSKIKTNFDNSKLIRTWRSVDPCSTGCASHFRISKTKISSTCNQTKISTCIHILNKLNQVSADSGPLGRGTSRGL